MERSASIIVYRGKAYVPTQAQIEGVGGHLDVEPIYVVGLTVEELTQVLEQVFVAGNPMVPVPTQEEMRRHSDVVPKAAGVRSWKALARDGAAYSIGWRDDGILLYMSMVDEKGRFVWDPAKTRRFPPDTGIRTLAEAILEDTRSRLELWE
jgi:hypothetical protein